VSTCIFVPAKVPVFPKSRGDPHRYFNLVEKKGLCHTPFQYWHLTQLIVNFPEHWQTKAVLVSVGIDSLHWCWDPLKTWSGPSSRGRMQSSGTNLIFATPGLVTFMLKSDLLAIQGCSLQNRQAGGCTADI